MQCNPIFGNIYLKSDKKACVSSCKLATDPSTYPDDYDDDHDEDHSYHECRKCSLKIPDCLICISSDICTKCSNGKFLKSDGSACVIGFFLF